jgi:hypothetical protein
VVNSGIWIRIRAYPIWIHPTCFAWRVSLIVGGSAFSGGKKSVVLSGLLAMIRHGGVAKPKVSMRPGFTIFPPYFSWLQGNYLNFGTLLQGNYLNFGQNEKVQCVWILTYIAGIMSFIFLSNCIITFKLHCCSLNFCVAASFG